MRQTTVQNSNAIRFGSGKVEVGDTVGSLVDLGAMRNVSFEENWDEVTIESDNAGELYVEQRNQTAAIAGDLMEVELENLKDLRGGLDSYSTQDGSLVSGATQSVTSGNWDYDKFIKIENQNADGSAITVNSVTASTDGVLTADDDYYLAQNEHGEYGIWIDGAGTLTTTTSQDITIDYDYTPAASQTLKSGGKRTISPKVVRITNVDENGNKFQITIFKAYNQSGITLELPADDDEEPAMTPINLQGRLDEARTAGEQLFEIYDEQGVA